MKYNGDNNMERLNEKCAICGNEINNHHYHVNEKMFLMNDNGFDYLLCSKCGTLQLNTNIDNMSDYYPKAYSCFDKNKNTKAFDKVCNYIIGNLILKSNMKFLSKNKYEYLTYLLGLKIKKTSKILDIGCGSGIWLEKLSTLGFRNLTGVDRYNQRNVITNGKWKFISGQVFDIHSKFDVITLHHSFEHMDNPLKVLSKIKKILNENGVCIIRIPIMNKYAWRKYKTNWVQIDAPRHLFLYSEKAMRYLGNQSGLKLDKIIYDSFEFQFWGSEVYASEKKISLLTATRIKSTLFSKKTIEEYKNMSKKLNKAKDGDQAIFIFRHVE